MWTAPASSGTTPAELPHWNTVHGYFARWQQEGLFAQLNGLLRQLLRQKEGREAEPSACMIDAQSVKTSTGVLASPQGIDAGKKIVGRKRSIVPDTIGLLLAMLVTAASVQDSTAGAELLDQVAAENPRIRKAWVDGGYRHHLVEHAAASTWELFNTSLGPAAAMPRRRRRWQIALREYALSPSTRTGIVRGRPVVARGTRNPSSTWPNAVASLVLPSPLRPDQVASPSSLVLRPGADLPSVAGPLSVPPPIAACVAPRTLESWGVRVGRTSGCRIVGRARASPEGSAAQDELDHCR